MSKETRKQEEHTQLLKDVESLKRNSDSFHKMLQGHLKLLDNLNERNVMLTDTLEELKDIIKTHAEGMPT